MSVMCKVCGSKFTTQYNLNRHQNNIHGVKPESVAYSREVYNHKCLEDGCASSYKKNADLISHLENCHKLKIRREEHEFTDMNGKNY